jgi:hypothetical protein
VNTASARTSTGRVLRLVNDDASCDAPALIGGIGLSRRGPVNQSVHAPSHRSDAGSRARLAGEDQRRRDEVAIENSNAAGLSHDDARWVFAQQVFDSLDGGRAAILPPDVRRALVTRGQRLGLRPFDANLVIAIVQEQVRRGDGPPKESASQLNSRLRMVGPPRATLSGAEIALAVFLTIALAAGTLALLVAWITGV